MAELVDARASGARIRKDVEVRVLFWAPEQLFFRNLSVLTSPSGPIYRASPSWTIGIAEDVSSRSLLMPISLFLLISRLQIDSIGVRNV